MGPCAVVKQRGRDNPAHEPEDAAVRSWAISQPRALSRSDFAVIGVKAAVAHRRAYDPDHARASHFVETPGPCSSNLAELPVATYETRRCGRSHPISQRKCLFHRNPMSTAVIQYPRDAKIRPISHLPVQPGRRVWAI